MLGLFTVGLVLGGVLSALVLWLLSGLATPVPEPVRAGLAVAAAAVAVLRDAGLVRFRLPQNARQIPREVLRDAGRGALRFGFELGTGVRTYVSATLPYVLAVAILLAGPDAGTAVLAGVGFGLGRALTPGLRYASGGSDGWDRALRSRLALIKVGGGLTGLAILVLMVVTGTLVGS